MLLLIVLAVYTVKLYNDNKDTITILESEKLNIESDLEELIADYNHDYNRRLIPLNLIQC